jgi:hypothetical protein
MSDDNGQEMVLLSTISFTRRTFIPFITLQCLIALYNVCMYASIAPNDGILLFLHDSEITL